MTNDSHILIIDDEIQIRRLLEITLSANGYTVSEAATGNEGVLFAATHHPQLILLDLGLPDSDGHEILQRLREWYKHPVIILSVRNTEEDIIRALDLGANDYLTKPFRSGELLARIRSALRHEETETSPILLLSSLSIDFPGHIVKKHGEILHLTATEFSLLSILIKNAGRVLTHQYLLREVWGFGYVGQTQYLRVFVGQLRKKIEDDPANPKFILTEAGIGYRFSE